MQYSQDSYIWRVLYKMCVYCNTATALPQVYNSILYRQFSYILYLIIFLVGIILYDCDDDVRKYIIRVNSSRKYVIGQYNIIISRYACTSWYYNIILLCYITIRVSKCIFYILPQPSFRFNNRPPIFLCHFDGFAGEL